VIFKEVKHLGILSFLYDPKLTFNELQLNESIEIAYTNHIRKVQHNSILSAFHGMRTKEDVKTKWK
jgi:hypothetical protein